MVHQQDQVDLVVVEEEQLQLEQEQQDKVILEEILQFQDLLVLDQGVEVEQGLQVEILQQQLLLEQVELDQMYHHILHHQFQIQVFMLVEVEAVAGHQDQFLVEQEELEEVEQVLQQEEQQELLTQVEEEEEVELVLEELVAVQV